MVLEFGIGPIACHATLEQARFSTTAPLNVLATPDVIEIATAIGIAASDVVLDTHPTTTTIGLLFTLTEVANRHILSQAKINIDALKRFAQSYPQANRFGQYVYTRSDGAIHARMFDPLDNIPEDPATGSAAATLGTLLVNCTQTPQKFSLYQSDDMGRSSQIEVHAEAGQFAISGSAVAVMEGNLL